MFDDTINGSVDLREFKEVLLGAFFYAMDGDYCFFELVVTKSALLLFCFLLSRRDSEKHYRLILSISGHTRVYALFLIDSDQSVIPPRET